MTPAEIVACVERMMWQVLTCQNRIRASHDWYGTRTGDDALNETATFARAAFHEAGRLLDFCEGSRVWCECGDQITSEGWPNGDPVLCWVCTVEHKRRIAEAEAERAEVWRLLVTDDGAHPPIPNELDLVENVRMLIREARAAEQALNAANYWKAEHLAGNEEIERLRKEDKTCGTCADWERSFPNMPLKSGSRGRCNSETSECATVTDGETWPADHGCLQWRAKEEEGSPS